MTADNKQTLEAQLLSIRPFPWPTSPAYFLDFTEEGLGRQLKFYEGCYPGLVLETLSYRTVGHITYLRTAINMVRESKKPKAAPKPDDKYTQLLMDLDL